MSSASHSVFATVKFGPMPLAVPSPNDRPKGTDRDLPQSSAKPAPALVTTGAETAALPGLGQDATGPFQELDLTGLQTSSGRVMDWIWKGYIAAGNVTLLISQWKSGKSTLMSVLLSKLGGQEDASHTKILIGAAFICGGCHWLKTPPFRIKTWLELQNGVVLLPSKPPHIIDCLGWTQQQLEALRDRDLKKQQADTALLARLDQQVQQGRAAIVPAPPERLSPEELERLVKPGQVMVVPWRIDLTALTRYGYSESEIVVFEQRMYTLAVKRMTEG